MDCAILRIEPTVSELIPAATWSLSVLAAGFGLWRWVEPRRRRAVPWGLCAALGCATAMVVVSIGAAVHAAMAGAVVFAIGGVVALALGMWRRGCPTILRTQGLLRSRPVMYGSVGLLGVAVVGWLMQFPLCLRPQVSYDVLSYHLPIAHAMRGDVGLGYVEGNFYSRMPVGGFALYVPSLSDRATTLGDPGIRFILWLVTGALALAVGELAGQLRAGPLARKAAVVLTIYHPMVIGVVLNSYNDVLTALLSVCAAEVLLVGLSSRRSRWIMVAGVLAGSAIAVKFSALGVVAFPLGLLALGAGATVKTQRLRTAFMNGLYYTVGILGGFGLWLVRAMVLGGNPLHPFAGDAPGWSSEQARFVVEEHHPLSVASGAYWSSLFRELSIFDYKLGLASVSVSAVLLLAILRACNVRKASGVLLFGAAMAGYAAWSLVDLNPARFALPVVLWMVALAVSVLSWRRLRGPLKCAGIAVLAVAFVLSVKANLVNLTAGADAEFWKEQARMAQPPPKFLELVAESTDEGGVLLLFEARGRLFPPGQSVTTVWDAPAWGPILKASSDEVDFAGRLHGAGFTQLVVNEFEWGRLLDFYSGAKGGPFTGKVTVREEEELVGGWLGDYPSCRFAKFSDRELLVLARFLRLCRRGADLTLPAGPASEIWSAPIPNNPSPSGQATDNQ